MADNASFNIKIQDNITTNITCISFTLIFVASFIKQQKLT